MPQFPYSRAEYLPPNSGGALQPSAPPFVPAPAPPHFPTEDPAGGVAEFLSLNMRHRGVLVTAGLLGIVVALVYSFLTPPQYSARTALMIQNPNLNFLNTRDINPTGDAPSSDTGLTDITTQIQVIGSERIVDRTIEHLRKEGSIAPLEKELKSSHSFLHKWVHPNPESPEEQDYALHELLKRKLTVKQVGPTRAVEITFTSPDPKFAATLVNTVAGEYVNATMEERVNKSKQTETWLSGELEEMRKRLQQSEAELQAYARSSGLLFASTSGDSAGTSDISGSRLSQLQIELSAAQNDRVSAQSHYETALLAKPADLPDVLNDSSLRSLQEKLTDLQRQRAELLSTFTESNERVRKIDSQIPPLEGAYAAQRSSILSRIHDDYNMALRREKLLNNSYERQANVVVDKTNKGIQYGILKRQVDSNQQLYESTLEEVKRAGVASTIRASNIDVFDPATPARRPVSPNMVLNAGLGAFGGLLSGMLFIFFTYGGTLHRAGEAQVRTGLRELGVIPNGWDDASLSSMGRRILSATAPFRRGSPGIPNEEAIELATWSRKPGATAESFRSLLTSILLTGENHNRPRTIVMTSANPSEGKTTLTCNLGIALAEVQQRVLLIDGDLRNPRLHKIFGLDNEVGLSTLLSRSSSAAKWDLKVMPTFVPRLFVLPAGPATSVPANLLHSSRLADILFTLRKQFDMVIIDSPPCRPATDARLLGRLSDAVILVVRAGRTPWEQVHTVVQQFGQDRTHVLGTVLNDARKPARDYVYSSAAV